MPAVPRLLLAVPLAALCLAACVAGAPTARPTSPATTPDEARAGTRTVVTRRVGGAALVVTVTRGDGGTEARMETVDESGERTLIVEEVVVGEDRYVHVAAAEHGLFDRAAWIHFDQTDERHLAFLAANQLGLVELAQAPAGPGIEVTRTRLVPAPVVAAPDSLPVIPFDDVEVLARRPT